MSGHEPKPAQLRNSDNQGGEPRVHLQVGVCIPDQRPNQMSASDPRRLPHIIDEPLVSCVFLGTPGLGGDSADKLLGRIQCPAIEVPKQIKARLYPQPTLTQDDEHASILCV
jgi:hypothetical protein